MLQRSCKEWDQKATGSNAKKGGKRKQISLRKSLGGGGKSDDSEDDFKPGKSLPKAPQSKQAKAGTSKKNIDVDDDDSDYVKVAVAPKKAAASKKPTKLESESGSDAQIAVKPPPKKAPPKKAPPKAAAIDSDSDVQMMTSAPDKGKGKAKETVAPKRKR